MTDAGHMHTSFTRNCKHVVRLAYCVFVMTTAYDQNPLMACPSSAVPFCWYTPSTQQRAEPTRNSQLNRVLLLRTGSQAAKITVLMFNVMLVTVMARPSVGNTVAASLAKVTQKHQPQMRDCLAVYTQCMPSSRGAWHCTVWWHELHGC